MENADLFYLGINGESAGPYPLTEIQQGIAAGTYGPETGIWNGTEWVTLAEFALTRWNCAAMSAPAAVTAELEVESAPGPAPAAFAFPRCHAHPERDAARICAICHRDFCSLCLTTIEGRGYCPACQSARPSTLACQKLPWWLIVPLLAGAALFGYGLGMYAVVTIGTGIALGMHCWLVPRRQWWIRLALALLAIALGVASYHFRVGA